VSRESYYGNPNKGGMPTVNLTVTIRSGNAEPVVFRVSAAGQEPQPEPSEKEASTREAPYFYPRDTCSREPILVDSPKLVRLW
jgi:hypothetical protein